MLFFSSRSHRREWALLSFHSVCLSVYHDWSITTRVNLFWIPCLPYFGCQRENMQNFAYFQRVFLPLRMWRIVPSDLSVRKNDYNLQVTTEPFYCWHCCKEKIFANNYKSTTARARYRFVSNETRLTNRCLLYFTLLYFAGFDILRFDCAF